MQSVSVGAEARQLRTDPQLVGADPQLVGADPQLVGADPQLVGAEDWLDWVTTLHQGNITLKGG